MPYLVQVDPTQPPFLQDPTTGQLYRNPMAMFMSPMMPGMSPTFLARPPRQMQLQGADASPSPPQQRQAAQQQQQQQQMLQQQQQQQQQMLQQGGGMELGPMQAHGQPGMLDYRMFGGLPMMGGGMMGMGGGGGEMGGMPAGAGMYGMFGTPPMAWVPQPYGMPRQ